MHEPLPLHITRAQLHKLRAGHQIQIKHEHIGHPHGIVFRHLHPETHRKILKAYHAHKGVRIHITEPEFEGTGVREFFQKAKRWFQKNEKYIKPIASTVMDIGAEVFPKFAPARAVIRQTTGYGIENRPTHFVGQPMEGYGEAHYTHARAKKHKRRMRGDGVIPAGYAGF